MKKAIAVLLIMMGAIILFQTETIAHTPYLMISDNEDGTFDISGGYSDGSSAARTPILLKSKKTGKILWQGRLDRYGELVSLTKPEEPYIIVFDGGPGHILKKEGPLLTKKSSILAGAPVDKNYPLDDDFTYIKDILPEPLTIQDPNGVIRVVTIMQGYKHHYGKGMGEIMKKLEEKRKKGAKVDLKINDVPLCFGVTSGYLSLKFAIEKLYGKEIPKGDDFKMRA